MRLIGGDALESDEKRQCLELWATSFASDHGLRALWGIPGRPVPKDAAVRWFRETLQLQGWGGALMAAFDGSRLAGAAVVSNLSCRPSVASYLLWTFRTAWQLGFGGVRRTIHHDRQRRRHMPEAPLLVVKLVCVAREMRGKCTI